MCVTLRVYTGGTLKPGASHPDKQGTLWRLGETHRAVKRGAMTKCIRQPRNDNELKTDT